MVSANTQPVSPFVHFGSNRSMFMANTMPVLNSSPIALSAPSSARDRVVAVARIFQRREAVAVDAGLADAEAASR